MKISMTLAFKKTLFIFRRDLRLFDNTGLLFALKNSEKVIPCFIFTPEQIDHNSYRSDHCLQFMLESLEDLEKQLQALGGKLFLFHAPCEEVVKRCLKEVDAVIVNRDYTPYSIARDKKIEHLCAMEGKEFLSFDDALLNPPENTLKQNGEPYTVFTPFFRNALKLPIKKPEPNPHHNYFTGNLPHSGSSAIYKKILPKRIPLSISGGRSAGQKILKHLTNCTQYAHDRDYPALGSPTTLSPYLKFTVLSPRETYFAIGKNHELIRSLYWRDFFSTIAFFFPHVFKGAFREKYDKLAWSNDEEAFSRWCEGKTGFPLVDAGMRELNETGFMHNRVRMVVASFLTKDLHINWQWGEKYFAEKLIDYDPAVNNGNWQWAASTGCDAQPYFRIFNPWRQQEKFDKEAIYIKKWVKELQELPSRTIHTLYKEKAPTAYPKPLVEHGKESAISLGLYRSI